MSKKKAAAHEQNAITKYMRNQNRPFSVQNLVDALQSENIKKAACERALAALEESQVVTRKDYGKTKLFLYNQANIELPEEEVIAAEKDEISDLTEKIVVVDEELATLSSERAALECTLSLEEAREKVSELDESVSEKEKRLGELGDPKELPTEADKLKVETDYFRARSAWKKRKRMVKEILDTVSESMQKTPKELAEMVGLETDEEAGVDIKSFPEIGDPTKGTKGGTKRKRSS